MDRPCKDRTSRGVDGVVALRRTGVWVAALAVLGASDVPKHRPLETARRHHDCGVILLKQSRPREAIVQLLASLTYDPTNVVGVHLIGRIFADQGRLDKAWQMTEKYSLRDLPQMRE